MGDSNIAWTEKTWNPVRGCTRVSPGCQHCFAENLAGTRMSGPGQAYEGFAENGPSGPRWTGKVSLIPEKLTEPLKWRKPAMIFVNSMSDLFHERLSFQDIAAVFGVMVLAEEHTFQILTKRPERAAEWFQWIQSNPLHVGDTAETARRIQNGPAHACLSVLSLLQPEEPKFLTAHLMARLGIGGHATPAESSLRRNWPLPNVWLGVSVESRDYLPRLDHLRRCPAAVRFASLEPLLGDLGTLDLSGIGWLIAGGESGPGRRPAEVAWYRSIAEQASAAGVPFFMKQDSGARPGQQGRIPADLWAKKEMPT